jgi:2-octaprenyl-6-methoxyphenol hydroxylase
MNMRDITTDIAIAGGGFAGLLLAHALAGAGLSVCIVDRAPLTREGAADGRVFALSGASQRVLAGLDLWARLDGAAQPVERIETRDGASALGVILDRDELDPAVGPLGYVVESGVLARVLRDAVRAEPRIELRAPVTITALESGTNESALVLDDGTRITARLVVGADGRESTLRKRSGINVTQWKYDQTAIVTAITHALPHDGTAEERFLEGGAFAVLPRTDGADGAHRSSVIWTESTARAADVLNLNDADFANELSLRCGDARGDIGAVGPRWSYPLALSLAESYVAHRLALIGDAAHALHPVAGQGLNLGIRDVAALAEVIVDARRTGLDFGMKTVLVDYELWRRFDNTCLAAATDVINRVFKSDNVILRAGRRVAMAALNASAPARHFFMQEAMGLRGELPRLVRGQPL